jgi:hypothetical protein
VCHGQTRSAYPKGIHMSPLQKPMLPRNDAAVERNVLNRRNLLFGAAATGTGAVLALGPAVSAMAAPPVTPIATPAATAAAVATTAAPAAAAAAATPTVIVGDTSRVYYPEQFGFVASAANHTTAMRSFFNALQKTGGTGILPPTEIRVTSTGIDFSSAVWAKQPLSGAPYGYPAITVQGYGRRVTTIKQIAGSTTDLFTVQGKLGADAGPAANNKVSATLTGFSLTGVKTGRHGLYLRSLLHSRITDLELNATGGAGVYFARPNFTAANDEYSYANVIEGLRVIAAGTWGVDCDGINAIDIVMRDTEIVNCVAGGIRIAPTNAKFENTRIIGCGAGVKAARGFVTIPTSNAASMISELNVSGLRLEGNSGPGGYQLELGAGVGATVNSYNVITGGDLGAHGVGVGVTNHGTRLTTDTLIGRGTMFMSPTKYPKQKVVVVGPYARDTRVERPALPNNPEGLYDAVVSNSGTRTLDHFGRALPAVTFIV